MRRYLQVMAFLITLQLIVSVMVMWPKSGDHQADKPFVAIDPALIVSIELSDLQNNQLQLAKTDKQWRIKMGDKTALANPIQVESLLQALMVSPVGWPVSTSKETLNRFALADDDYQWKISLATADGAQSQIVYFGSAAGAAKRHARKSDEATVHALNYSLADKIVKVRDWLQRDILALVNNDLVKIDAGDYVLSREGELWRLDGQRDDEVIDQDMVAMFAGRLDGLRVDDVVSGDRLAQIQAEKPVQTIRLFMADKAKPPIVYTFYKINDKNYLKREDVDGMYEISMLAASDLLKLRNQWLIPGKIIEPKQAQ